MKTAYYNGLKLKKTEKKPGKVACVIVTFFGDGGRTKYFYRDHNSDGIKSYQDNKLDNFKFSINCYSKFNPGMPCELNIVDNASTFPEGVGYLNALPYKVHHRENNGFSFGGYKWFWDNYPDYDYYLFHEQDCCPTKDGWLKELYDEFRSDPTIGVVGNCLEDREKADSNPEVGRQYEAIGATRDKLYNLDGAFFFTSRKVLERVKLRVLDGKTETSCYNEILFVQPILEAGFKIGALNPRKGVAYSYGMTRGDTGYEIKEVSPIVDSMVRKLSQEFKQYFYGKGLIETP